MGLTSDALKESEQVGHFRCRVLMRTSMHALQKTWQHRIRIVSLKFKLHAEHLSRVFKSLFSSRIILSDASVETCARKDSIRFFWFVISTSWLFAFQTASAICSCNRFNWFTNYISPSSDLLTTIKRERDQKFTSVCFPPCRSTFACNSVASCVCVCACFSCAADIIRSALISSSINFYSIFGFCVRF